ncbi:MAG TPA: hypothetical protein VGH19_17000 [Verrucomicrobiae bacterium]
MGLPSEPQTLTPEQVAELNSKLSEMRHNINNYLSMIIAATELVKRKPESAERFLDMIALQPPRVTADMQAFTNAFEKMLKIERE